MILYLHGFRSSPSSFKAQTAADYMGRHGLAGHFFCPQLPESPFQSVSLAAQLMEGHDPGRILLIGSSLGGYYANFLAERIGCKAVLLNPVIDPWNVRADIENPSGGQELAEWERDREKYAAELESFLVRKITRPERYLLIAATGDELLDYRQMRAHYEGAYQIIIEGSDHSLSEFPDYLDDILAFSGLQSV
jgi:predicted esterase YcpF (UPF0227 family)